MISAASWQDSPPSPQRRLNVMSVVTRHHAKVAGLTRYNSGKLCLNRHNSERWTGSGSCIACDSLPSRIASRRNATLRCARCRMGIPEPPRHTPRFCECCGKLPTETKPKLVIDHCHSTGKFRGWICDTCNRGIGMLGDNQEGVSRALHYLQRSTWA